MSPSPQSSPIKGEEVKVEKIAAMMQIIWITSHAAVFARWLRKE